MEREFHVRFRESLKGQFLGDYSTMLVDGNAAR